MQTAESSVSNSLDHLFRHHAGQMVSVLCRMFGLTNLEIVEDAVQEAMVVALKRWPYSGMPENQRAWLTQVAKNKVIDRLRFSAREFSADELAETLVSGIEPNRETFAGELGEDELRMIFACCDPANTPDSQVALTLKTVGGFSVSEIARAFLSGEEAVAKMLARAKKRLARSGTRFEIPGPDDLEPRLDAALKVLYLMFNEGYTASSGDDLVRKDLCFEAIRLCGLLASHPVTGQPKVHALLSLFLFQAARLSTRSDHSGDLLLLSEQDRDQWDTAMLARAAAELKRSAVGDVLSDYHLEAEIAAHHSLAPDLESTNWERILSCYDILQSRRFSIVAELNRIVVVERLKGPVDAMKELDRLEATHPSDGLNLFHITKAHLLAAIGETERSRDHFAKAIETTTNQPIRRFLEKRLGSLRNKLRETA